MQRTTYTAALRRFTRLPLSLLRPRALRTKLKTRTWPFWVSGRCGIRVGRLWLCLGSAARCGTGLSGSHRDERPCALRNEVRILSPSPANYEVENRTCYLCMLRWWPCNPSRRLNVRSHNYIRLFIYQKYPKYHATNTPYPSFEIYALHTDKHQRPCEGIRNPKAYLMSSELERLSTWPGRGRLRTSLYTQTCLNQRSLCLSTHFVFECSGINIDGPLHSSHQR